MKIKFKEKFPSLSKYRIDYDEDESYCYLTDIEEYCLDKEIVKNSLIKNVMGSHLARSKVCEKPYGDICGYCYRCNQNQKILINAILKELGLEN